MFVSQEVNFCAAHRLHNPRLSNEENIKLFGPCNWIHSHGHNYKVTITLEGKVDPKTGMFCEVLKFENAIKAVVQPMDHKNIDVDIPWFKDRLSTMENLSIYIWQCLKDTLEEPDFLFEVRVREKEGSYVSYRGE